jgi:OOP family OmpA-OmpF porin
MRIYDKLLIAAGGAMVAGLAVAASAVTGGAMVRQLQADAGAAIARANGAPVTVDLRDAFGLPSRHATLSGGEALPDPRRGAIAASVGSFRELAECVGRTARPLRKARLQPTNRPLPDVVVGLLRTRSVRFEEGSAAIAPGSDVLLMKWPMRCARALARSSR